jgi:hypothetical protein
MKGPKYEMPLKAVEQALKSTQPHLSMKQRLLPQPVSFNKAEASPLKNVNKTSVDAKRAKAVQELANKPPMPEVRREFFGGKFGFG